MKAKMCNVTTVVVAGFAGAGKSWLGKLIAQRLSFTYLDKDSLSSGFVEGLAGSQDVSRGMRLIEKASTIGLHGEPMLYLAQAYLNGVYVSLDYDKAYFWSVLSSCFGGDWNGDYTSIAKGHLSAERVRDIESKVEAWVAKAYSEESELFDASSLPPSPVAK